MVFAIGLGLTSGSLALVHATTDNPHRALEVGVLIAANLLATVVRFVLLRAWVFHPRRTGAAPTSPTSPTAELSADGAGGA